ncbi:MAG: hypothetical protein AAF696_39330 [Bacteroidota bacterium]
MNSALFPHRYRYFGWPLLVIGVISGTIWMVSDYSFDFLDIQVISLFGGNSTILVSGEEKPESFVNIMSDNFTNELTALFTLVGAFLVAFSKEKVEDEFFQQLRFESIIWALKCQAIILFLGILLLYNFEFLFFMMIALMSFFIIYIGRYHYQLYRYRKVSNAE